MTATAETKADNEASEKYAEEYANKIYNKKYPLQHKYYSIFNGLYHLLYWRRILKDNEIRKEFKAGLTLIRPTAVKRKSVPNRRS